MILSKAQFELALEVVDRMVAAAINEYGDEDGQGQKAWDLIREFATTNYPRGL